MTDLNNEKLNKQLIDKVRRGKADAFEMLVDMNTGFVMSVCLSHMKNTHDAEDACQEVFLRVWKSIDSFRNESAFTTYLYTISRNVCLDILRKKSRSDTEELSDTLCDPSPSPEQQTVDREFAKIVDSALHELDTDMKTVLLLRHKAELSYAEISEVLGISEGTVKSRISRARERLLKILKEKNVL